MNKTTQIKDSSIISAEEAAKLLGISVATLIRLDKNGALKPIRFTPTSKRRYLYSDLEKFINEKRGLK